jgi:hypothetical protein
MVPGSIVGHVVRRAVCRLGMGDLPHLKSNRGWMFVSQQNLNDFVVMGLEINRAKFKILTHSKNSNQLAKESMNNSEIKIL